MKCPKCGHRFKYSPAADLGRKGGKVVSKVKSEAARANGAKGGRPRKPDSGAKGAESFNK